MQDSKSLRAAVTVDTHTQTDAPTAFDQLTLYDKCSQLS